MSVWLANFFKAPYTYVYIIFFSYCLVRGLLWWLRPPAYSPNSHTLVAGLTVLLQAGGGLLQDCHSTWTPLAEHCTYLPTLVSSY